jgi:hypothetical protein
MDRSTIKELGFKVRDPIDPYTFWEYCPICGRHDKEDGRICGSCIEALNIEIGE